MGMTTLPNGTIRFKEDAYQCYDSQESCEKDLRMWNRNLKSIQPDHITKNPFCRKDPNAIAIHPTVVDEPEPIKEETPKKRKCWLC